MEIDFEDARSALVELLGVDRGRTSVEMEESHGSKVRLNWIRDIYLESYEAHQREYATKEYLLHLVGCTIFTNKSVTSICVLLTIV